MSDEQKTETTEEVVETTPADAKAMAGKEATPTEEVKEEKKKEVKEKETEEVSVPEKFQKLVSEIEKMSVLDLAKLVKVLEKKFGVSAAAPAMAIAAPTAGTVEEVDEKSEYNVILTGIGEKKIEVIKAVRDITQKGLKEAKDLVDSAVNEPQIIKEGATKEEAEEMKKKFEVAGATIELK